MIRKMLDSQHSIDVFSKGDEVNENQIGTGGWVYTLNCGSNTSLYMDGYSKGYRLLVEETFRNSRTYDVIDCYKE